MERMVYETLSRSLETLLVVHLRFRRYKGLEHPTRWLERLGYPSLIRPPGPLIWLHAVSLGEGLAAIPIIEKCIQMRPVLNILMTTGTVTAFDALKRTLPQCVLCQFAPLDTPAAGNRFLTYWHPQAGIFMENELWPNLLLTSASRNIPMALLNARMSERSFSRWWQFTRRSLVAEILGSFSLICPLSTNDAIRLQLLGAPPAIIHFAGNSKYVSEEMPVAMELSDREVWLASSTHAGEEEVISRVHLKLKRSFPHLLTIIAPRHPRRASAILCMLRNSGLKVAQRSLTEQVCPDTDVYLADTIGELKSFYSSVPIAFVGGSLLDGLAGHNIAEAAACGCAVLTGPHIGHFSKMLTEMQSISPLSIEQVFSEDGLVSVLKVLFTDPSSLQARREAARHASRTAAVGVVQKLWTLLDLYIFKKAVDIQEVEPVNKLPKQCCEESSRHSSERASETKF